MPSATRNTKPISEIDGSDAGKSKTWLNITALMPMVAPNDSTLASTSSSGAASERSSSASTMKMTTRIAGITRARSASVVSRASSWIAVLPPTITSGLTRSRSVRSARTVSAAAADSAEPFRVASTTTSPSTTLGAGADEPVGGPDGR